MMDKEKFISWIEEKTNIILVNTPIKLIDNDESKIYMQGFVTALDEIKLQVKNGKFDI